MEGNDVNTNRFRILIVMFALSAVIAASVDRTIAQDATPAAGPIAPHDLAPGVVAEVLAGAPSALAPGQTVWVARFVFQSGAEIFPHSHPGTTVLGVLSGSFGWPLQAGTAHLVRGAAGTTPSPVEDVTIVGTEVILGPGDAIYYESDVIHTARGAGDTETVVLETLVLETGAPLLMLAGTDMGTPST